jgi:hypothetical protein
MRLGTQARLRYVAIRHSRCISPTDTSVVAKVVVIEVKSNYNNAAANWLRVVPDTADIAL